jgi:hypothetical protein
MLKGVFCICAEHLQLKVSVNPVDFLSAFEFAGPAKVLAEIAINGFGRTSRLLYRASTSLGPRAGRPR